MLRRISCDQVKLGMYIQGFGGSWFQHPFWRAKFLLESADDVARVRQSGVPHVIIDDVLGLGVEGKAPVAQAKTDSRTAALAPVRSRLRAAEPEADPVKAKRDADHDQAVALVSRSKKIVRGVFDSARLGRAVRIAEVMPIVDEVAEAVARNSHALMGVIRLKSKDEYTYLHSVAVCTLMVTVARHLDMDEAFVRDMGLAGLLHDIGKMGLTDEILNKPGRLTDEEFEQVRGHPDFGYTMLVDVPGIAELALDVCRHHHEKVDGSGYPFGLAGDAITLAARLGAICDVYDALTSDRPYKEGWTPAEAIAAMWSWEGHFDRELLFSFMQSIGVFPPGILVRLRSNRLGVVLDNQRRASRPRACAFFATREMAFIDPEIVIIKDDFASDQIVAAEDPALWGFTGWDEMLERLMQGRAPKLVA